MVPRLPKAPEGGCIPPRSPGLRQGGREKSRRFTTIDQRHPGLGNAAIRIVDNSEGTFDLRKVGTQLRAKAANWAGSARICRSNPDSRSDIAQQRILTTGHEVLAQLNEPEYGGLCWHGCRRRRRLGGNVGRGERVEAGELVQEQQLPDTEF